MNVCVVGLGYVGRPLAQALASAHTVYGYDTEPTANVLPTTDCADAWLICVPTPLDANREPDLTAVQSAASRVGKRLLPGNTVVVESTVYPGATRDLIPILEETSGLKAGQDFALAFSPERINPGSDTSLTATPKLVAGLTSDCLQAALDVYAPAFDHMVPVPSLEACELAKLLENTYRAVNIALVNELDDVARAMGINFTDAIDAASTKPYGFARFDPGPGMGGHCLPVDPFYLSWKAREFGKTAEFVELAGRLNTERPLVYARRAQDQLNARGLAVRGATVCIVGVSYKPGVPDIRNTPAEPIADFLEARGATVTYVDSLVSEWHGRERLDAPDGADVVIDLHL